jgi:hypothetical protein
MGPTSFLGATPQIQYTSATYLAAGKLEARQPQVSVRVADSAEARPRLQHVPLEQNH